MTLPQVHYNLAKPALHRPRQWSISKEIQYVQASAQMDIDHGQGYTNTSVINCVSCVSFKLSL